MIAETTPIGRPSASSAGPCSIWTSTKAATWSARSVERPVRIAAEGRERVAHQDAVRILLIERVLRIVAGQRPRSGERGAVAHALLVAEGDDLDGVVEPLAAGCEVLHDGERGQRAVVAVVAARVPHGVDVRAQHQRRRARLPAFVARDHVAGGVDPGRHPRFGAPADEGGGGAPVRVGKEEARQPAGLVGEGGEGVEPRHQPGARGAFGVGKSGRHFAATLSLSHRASTARSSSVIWLKLLGGIAWVSTACMAMAGAKRAMCSGVSSSTPFRGFADPVHRLRGMAHHATQLHDIDDLLRRLRLVGARGGGRKVGEADQAAHARRGGRRDGEGEIIASAATAQAHHGALACSACHTL